MNLFKKVLAFVLALAMVVTAVPTADAKAAAKQPKLNNTKKILYVGQSYTLKIGNLPANWKKCTYAWSASNKNVTVKKGKYGQAANVKAVKAGTATVTVKMTYPQTAAQKKAKKKTVKTFKCVVTVKTPSVKFTTTADRIEVGETAQFTAKAAPSTATITYSSSDAAVATVDATGLVTAVADGTATIKASIKVGNVTKTASKTVEVYTAPTEAKQTKVKEITITSGKVVTKDSKIEVKKGSVEVALAEKKDGSKEINIDATGKTVVLTTAAKLSKGEYTVTIDGVTANFTAEDEKVDKIEFTGEKAVLDAQVCDQCFGKNDAGTCGGNHNKRKIYKTAKVGYKVYNQFGEDVTDATSVKLSGSDVTSQTPANKGEVEFTSKSLDGYRLNDIVAAVVIYNQNGVAVTKAGTFTISNESAISELSIKDGVYNKKGEAVTITEDTDLTNEKLYVLVSAKDQYGNTKTALTHNDNVMVQMAGGLTNLALNGATPTSTEITVDGVKYAGFQLNKTDALGAGTATLIIISKGTGVTAQGTVTVANGAKVDTIQIQVPDLIVAGEDNKLGYTALDSYGKEVTKLSSLTDVTNVLTEAQAKTAGKGIFAKENPATGKAELYYKAASKAATGDWDPTAVIDYDTVSLITKTYKSTAVNFSIKPNAQPTAIVGTDKLTTGALAGQYFEIVKENIKVADQYGRKDKLKIANYEIFAYFDKKTGNNSFDTTTGALVNVTTDITTAKALDVKDGDGTIKATSKAKAVVPADESQADTNVIFVLAKKGTVSLKSNDDKSILSTYPVTFTSSKETNITSYEVADIGNVYCGKEIYDANGDRTYDAGDGSLVSLIAKYDKGFDVKGVTSDGVKVTIPTTDYTVTIAGVDATTGAKLITSPTAGKITAVDLESQAAGKDQLLTKKDTAEVSLTFTFKDGKQIEKKVTLTKDAPKVKEVKIKDKKDALEVAPIVAANTAISDYNKTVAAINAIKTAINATTVNDNDEFDTVKSAVDAKVTAVTIDDNDKLAALQTAVKSTTVNPGEPAEKGSAALTKIQNAYIATADGKVTDAKTALTGPTTKIVVATQIATAGIAGASLIEAKDQYGVDIASVAVPNAKVTVSNAKDPAGNDITFTNVKNNGLETAEIYGWATDTKADVKLVFDGGFVFTAKIVAK